MEKNIKVPVKNEDLTDLKIGDVITLTGNIITARDQAHKKFWNRVLRWILKVQQYFMQDQLYLKMKTDIKW